MNLPYQIKLILFQSQVKFNICPLVRTLTCLLRNVYAGQEATVRTGHGTTDWFQIAKGVKAVYCHSAYLAYMQSTS